MPYTYCTLRADTNMPVRLSSWEEGLDIELFCGGMWTPLPDDPKLVVFKVRRYPLTWDEDEEDHYSDHPRPGHAFSAHFHETVPDQVRRIVAQFQYGQLHCLKALRQFPDLHEIGLSCPPLFWLIIGEIGQGRGLQAPQISNLLKLKRKDILANLGYVGRPSAVRFLDKIAVAVFCEDDLSWLQIILRSEETLKLLRHCPVVSSGHLLAGANCLELFQYRFARKEMAAENISTEFVADLCTLFRDSRNMAAFMERGTFADSLRNIRHLWQLHRIHDQLAAELGEREHDSEYFLDLVRRFGSAFPLPPVKASRNIQPISTLKELVEEGRMMHHCVASYASAVFNRRCYIYRILAPERGTVEIELHAGGPMINQIRLQHNKMPGQETILSVQEWLAAGDGAL